MGTALLSGTTGVAGAVLRRTAGVEEVALTTGATGVEVAASTEDGTTTGVDETTGVTIGATGDEETATGVTLVATTGCVKVQGQSVTVKVVACGRNSSANARKSTGLQKCVVGSLPR